MLKKICGFLSGIILIVLALLAGVLIIPRLMGYEEMAVLTGSMEPEYPVGSLIYVREQDPETLQVGGVITYRLSGDTVVTNRIVEINTAEQTVTTIGDANESNDGQPIPFDSIVGKAEFKVPYLGFISMNIRTPQGIMAICGVLIVIILLTFIPEILSKDEEEENERKKKNPPKAGESNH